jgi:hemoglobin/transferrin/lactoferrin receptor protein
MKLSFLLTRLRKKEKILLQQTMILPGKKNRIFKPGNECCIIRTNRKCFCTKSQGGGGSPVIRGFEANKVLIVIDGVRMNNAIFCGGHLQNVITIDNAALDKVEVLFGPASVFLEVMR